MITLSTLRGSSSHGNGANERGGRRESTSIPGADRGTVRRSRTYRNATNLK
jgi:hypothetical protein